MTTDAFSDTSLDPAVRGFLHQPALPNGNALVYTHGAGGNSHGPFLIALAEAFAGAGFTVLRCDLPFRQKRSFGPPRLGDAERDREGLKNAVACMRKVAEGKIFLGGHSYGGRQCSMLCAEDPCVADGLLLTSYPLHPPGKPERLRTDHFPKLTKPALFVQGTRDGFGSIEELQAALKLISAKTQLTPVEGAGHDLGFSAKKKSAELPGRILEEFLKLFG
ncbi:MAG TPA: alpha/beta fold hydrolase [Terriglobales bacterium]|nr:alpha/beta fold hydrolase [Terriglobales bacterium]